MIQIKHKNTLTNKELENYLEDSENGNKTINLSGLKSRKKLKEERDRRDIIKGLKEYTIISFIAGVLCICLWFVINLIKTPNIANAEVSNICKTDKCNSRLNLIISGINSHKSKDAVIDYALIRVIRARKNPVKVSEYRQIKVELSNLYDLYKGQGIEHKYYFTSYDLGDINQNDSSPCIGASGKNLCKLNKEGIKTIALVSIKRKELGIKFGDKVELLGGPCPGIYQVEDEMNIRFRQKQPIYKPGTKYEIRGDIARLNKDNCGGVYKINKI